ncbi:MBL fold metallo-hydrolase [Marinitenerispora sediminis]|uniref:MBL fold metallo-hydrolase n=2 Tax=Marinitenerispora sediminis TaxID=1931232 RepID=A0A368SY66_9ACTN|nr:MBL fold metallo-hydrolase [Marinitenerispora sediminis]RCV48818.1 MBL fold metallo-hydrolase [Marinitenerispora sediminis]RCV49403.1 MBL fold metallo-hydrolase [Marinitenerispora sediminis]
MDMTEVLPDLHLLRFPFGHVYLWRDADAVTLIDTSVAGSAPAIAEGLRRLGRRPGDVRRVVLTHHHQDHAGSAAEIAAWGEAEVLAHRDDAPVVRGERPGAPPDFSDAPAWERELFENLPSLPPAPPCPVHRALVDGDVLDFAGGAVVVGAPGHTDGSIALHLPGPRVLVTGDAVAGADGRAILGVFNTDRARAIASLRRLAGLDVDVACFGHGEPVVGGAASALRDAAERAA